MSGLKKLLFIGMKGSGKSSQARLLKHFGFKHISTGDLIRDARKRKDPLVMPYERELDAGGLLPDQETFELLYQELGNLRNERGYILDGAVRNMNQAKIGLEKNLFEEVFFFDLTDEVAIKRAAKRYEIEKRGDDEPESAKRAIRIYHEQTGPVIDYLSGKRIPIYLVNASLSIPQVHNQVLWELRLK